MVQKSFGPTFTHVSGAPEAPVSYFKGFGGPPDGKSPFFVGQFCGNRSCGEPLKEGYSTVDSDLRHYRADLYLVDRDNRLLTCDL